MYVVGIAGTAKNTGKTTATVSLLKGAQSVGHRVVLTSIGYDGENLDNVTGLPKPRIHMTKGSMVVTADRCVQRGTARLEELHRFNDITTALGRLCLCRVSTAGTVVTSGPNQSSQLARVIAAVRQYEPDLMLVDGALNRIGPMVKTHGIVLATGAARSPVIDKLAAETGALDKILNLPVFTPAPGGAVISIPGIIDLDSLRSMLDRGGEKLNATTLVFQDAIKLLIAENPLQIKALLDHVTALGGRVEIISRIPLLLVTVNPFYPAYSAAGNTYSEAYVDAGQLKNRLQQAVSVPVIDVLHCPPAEVYSLLWEQLRLHAGLS